MIKTLEELKEFLVGFSHHTAIKSIEMQLVNGITITIMNEYRTLTALEGYRAIRRYTQNEINEITLVSYRDIRTEVPLG